jgi:hypothetical protein
VPGCTGKTQNSIKTDYCIEDPNIANAATYSTTFAQTDVPTFEPTNAPTLAPTFEQTDVPTYVPTLAATHIPTDAPDEERVRDPVATLTIVGQDGEPASSYPLKLCEGDCDSDADVSILVCQSEELGFCSLILSPIFHATTQCAGNLICYYRNENMPAPPGCEGTAGLDTRVDFCILPPPTSYVNTPTAPVPTGTPSTGAPVSLTSIIGSTLNAATSPTILPLGGREEIPHSTASPMGILVSTDSVSTIPAPPVAPIPKVPIGTLSTGAPVTLTPTVKSTVNAVTSPTILPVGGAAEIPYSTASPMVILVSTDSVSMIPAPTAVPAPNLEPLPILRQVGNNGQFRIFPLENCMGDCDTDADVSCCS